MKKYVMIFCAFLLVLNGCSSKEVTKPNSPHYPNIDANYVWIFGCKIDSKEKPKLLVAKDGKLVNVWTEEHGGNLKVIPPKGGYEKGATYKLTLVSGLTLVNGKELEGGQLTFTIKG